MIKEEYNIGDTVYYIDYGDSYKIKTMYITSIQKNELEVISYNNIPGKIVSNDITELQNILRKLRNENQKITDQIQDAIDQSELKKYDCEKFVGKYFIYRKRYYIFVKTIDRLYAGPRLNGSIFEKPEDDIVAYKDDALNLTWESISELEEITKVDFLEALNKGFTNFITNYER